MIIVGVAFTILRFLVKFFEENQEFALFFSLIIKFPLFSLHYYYYFRWYRGSDRSGWFQV